MSDLTLDFNLLLSDWDLENDGIQLPQVVQTDKTVRMMKYRMAVTTTPAAPTYAEITSVTYWFFLNIGTEEVYLTFASQDAMTFQVGDFAWFPDGTGNMAVFTDTNPGELLVVALHVA